MRIVSLALISPHLCFSLFKEQFIKAKYERKEFVDGSLKGTTSAAPIRRSPFLQALMQYDVLCCIFCLLSSYEFARVRCQAKMDTSSRRARS